jgi:hypothetical protein
VLPHALVADSLSVDQAVEATLRQLCPSLAPGCGDEACNAGPAAEPLLLVVDDINRSGQASVLLEKLLRWNNIAANKKESGWRLLCPLWPQNCTRPAKAADAMIDI